MHVSTPFADCQRVAVYLIKLNGSACDDAEHAAADLAGIIVERDPVHGGDGVVVDRAEGRD
jgi:hypothetical protein